MKIDSVDCKYLDLN